MRLLITVINKLDDDRIEHHTTAQPLDEKGTVQGQDIVEYVTEHLDWFPGRPISVSYCVLPW